jgi:hypothetical protein
MTLEDFLAIFPEDDWSEEDGPVLWHHIGEWGDICEAPIVSCGGSELATHQPWDGYYTHWSKLPPMRRWPLWSLQIAPPGSLICDYDW